MTKETIYGLDSKGNLKVLSVWPEGSKMIQSYGRFNGKMTKKEKQCHAKNTGRANATSAEEQAALACARVIKKKVDQEYYYFSPLEGNPNDDLELFEKLMKDFIAEKLASENDAPMLAYPIEKGRKHIKWDSGVLTSYKLDGIRCVAVYRDGKLVLKSRKNKTITSMEHIRKALEPVMAKIATKGSSFRLDGELYNHDYRENFEDLVSAIKKYEPGTSELVKFYIYDAIEPAFNAIDRTTLYTTACELILDETPDAPIVPVEQVLLHSQEEVDDFHQKALDKGYEGAMIKNAASKYKQTRSYDLLKIKSFQDAEYKIVNVIPMDADTTQGLYVCHCEKTGKTFKATPKCTVEKKQEILKNKEQYIGKLLTVKFFQLTEAGIPRFPVGLNVRDTDLQG